LKEADKDIGNFQKGGDQHSSIRHHQTNP